MPEPARQFEFLVTPEQAGERLDRAVARHAPELSRTRVQELIAAGLIFVGGRPAKGASRVRAGERVHVTAEPRPPLRAEPESIPLDVLYEDEDVLAINKPAGMIVHAGAGGSRGTLVNALLGRGQALSSAADALRPGIVHRLDKETSGVLLVAKNDSAHAKLSEAFRRREVKKTYIALVHGAMTGASGRIELAIARDPVHRTRMTATRAGALRNARTAHTDWRLLARAGTASLLEVQLHTGRTHQIRVHLAALRHPIVGDEVYGAPRQMRTAGGLLPPLGRNFLHAARLGFAQPRTGQWIELRAPLPVELLEFLRRVAHAAGDESARIDAALAPFL